MNHVAFRVGKKFVRGDRKGKRFTEVVIFESESRIHSYLWDTTDLFDKNKCNYIVEFYVLK